MEHTKRASLRATVILTAVNLIAQLLGLACRIGISRLAGAEVMGVYQLLMPAYAVLSAFVISGLSVSVSALTGTLIGQRAYQGAKRLVRLALRWLCLLWCIVALPTALGSDLISASFLGDARTRLGLLVLLPCLLLTGVENLQKHHFYGLGRAEFPAAVELTEQLARTAAILLLLAAFPDLTTEQRVALIVVGMLASELVSSMALTAGRFRLFLPEGKDCPDLKGKLSAAALPIGTAAVVGSILSALNAVVIPDRLICSGVAADQATAVYGVMFGMTLPLLMLPTCFVGAMCTILLPDLSCRLAQGQKNACRAAVRVRLQVISRILFPLLALLAALGPTVGKWVFQDERVGEEIVLLALSVAVAGWGGVLSSSLNGLGAQRENACIGIGVGAGELVLTWGLVGKYGITGCAWSMLLASSLETILRWRLCRQVIGLRTADLFRVLLPIPAAVLMGLCTELLDRGLTRWEIAEIKRMAICLAFGILFYLLMQGMIREKREDETATEC